jgi:hypothetical protein
MITKKMILIMETEKAKINSSKSLKEYEDKIKNNRELIIDKISLEGKSHKIYTGTYGNITIESCLYERNNPEDYIIITVKDEDTKVGFKEVIYK